jgi:hypothetical protein
VKAPLPARWQRGIGHGIMCVYTSTSDSRLAYWQTHSLLRPSDHIQAAALALASGLKMSSLP